MKRTVYHVIAEDGVPQSELEALCLKHHRDKNNSLFIDSAQSVESWRAQENESERPLQPVAVSAWVKCSERSPGAQPYDDPSHRKNMETRVLVYHEKWIGPVVMTCQYRKVTGWLDEDGRFPIEEPTHWQPLPAPPAALSVDGEGDYMADLLKKCTHWGNIWSVAIAPPAQEAADVAREGA